MKISLQWLKQYLPDAPEAPKIADLLTHAGLPVENIESVAGDAVLDIEVTSNRPDCLSHLGIARELSALIDRPFTDVKPQVTESAEQTSALSSVANDAPDLCPTYTARVIRNCKIAPSPQWLSRRLESVGLRPINNVVDVTNFVLFEMGQPLHAFDFDRLHEHRIVVRRPARNEKITTIDGHERTLDPAMLVIADANRPVALAGVMGGKDSEVSANTVNVLLESARFVPLSVRKTSRMPALKSDSSYRFERDIHPTP